jgi:hypothetical protein
MLGHKARDFKPLTAVSLDDLVPGDNFYRKVDRCLDLGFIRDLVCKLYSVMGRPSIDPIVFFKLQLIAFFEGIRSERQLMETVNVNLAHRWFIFFPALRRGGDIFFAQPRIATRLYACCPLGMVSTILSGAARRASSISSSCV